MLCPSCKSAENHVIDSRLSEGGLAIRRRRECDACRRRFTTKERVEEDSRITVIKANGQRVPFSRDKILAGVERACYKLDLPDEKLQRLVDSVEEEVHRANDREVSTEQIGEYVARRLRKLNSVAYVRFMSVYRKYNSINQFIEEISDVQVRAARESPAQQSLFEVP